jgi:hypothetical protein
MWKIMRENKRKKALAEWSDIIKEENEERKMLIISTQRIEKPFSLIRFQTIIQTFLFIQPFDVFQVFLSRLFPFFLFSLDIKVKARHGILQTM